MNFKLARQTSTAMIQAMQNAAQNVQRFPCLGCVFVMAVRMIPASAGPQVAAKTNGSSRYWFR